MMRRLERALGLKPAHNEVLRDIGLTGLVIVGLLTTASLIWYAFDSISKAVMS